MLVKKTKRSEWSDRAENFAQLVVHLYPMQLCTNLISFFYKKGLHNIEECNVSFRGVRVIPENPREDPLCWWSFFSADYALRLALTRLIRVPCSTSDSDLLQLYILPEGKVFESIYNNFRIYGSGLLFLVGMIVLAGVKVLWLLLALHIFKFSFVFWSFTCHVWLLESWQFVRKRLSAMFRSFRCEQRKHAHSFTIVLHWKIFLVLFLTCSQQ